MYVRTMYVHTSTTDASHYSVRLLTKPTNSPTRTLLTTTTRTYFVPTDSSNTSPPVITAITAFPQTSIFNLVVSYYYYFSQFLPIRLLS